MASIFGSATPASIGNDGATNLTLATRFFVTQAGFITHLRVYMSASSVVTRLRLWSAYLSTGGSAGEILAQVDSPTIVGTGWKDVALSSPIPVHPAAGYVVDALFTFAEYGYEAGLFATDHGSAPIFGTAYTSYPNGLYDYSTAVGVIPAGGGTGTAFFVDVVLDPTLPAQTRLAIDAVGYPYPTGVGGTDTVSLVLGTNFTVDETCRITGIYAGAPLPDLGPSSLKLWANGVELDEITVSTTGYETGFIIEWSFDAPITLSPGVTYCVSAWYQYGGTPFGFYSTVSGFYLSTFEAGPVTAPADDEAGLRNGVFVYDTSHTFPTSNFSHTLYHVGPVAIPADDPPPAAARRRPFILFA